MNEIYLLFLYNTYPDDVRFEFHQIVGSLQEGMEVFISERDRRGGYLQGMLGLIENRKATQWWQTHKTADGYEWRDDTPKVSSS